MGMEAYKGTAIRSGGKTLWTGEVRLIEDRLEVPLTWRQPQLIFVNSMSDWLHQSLPVSDIIRMCEVMRRADWHVYEALTRRAARLRDLANSDLRVYARLPHIWWGVSVENRQHGLRRLDCLREAPVAMRWLSIEPLLEDLGVLDLRGISWVVVGGESGHRARPFHLEWARDILHQCRAHGVPVFIKQLGTNPSSEGKRIELASFKGGDPAEWPEDLRVREWPPINRWQLTWFLRKRGSFNHDGDERKGAQAGCAVTR